MRRTRRCFLTGFCCISTSFLAGQVTAELGTGTLAPPAPQRVARLPAWKYGDSSVADDNLLMFRGNGPHTFYGTGPIPEKAPEIIWRFRTASYSTVNHGVPAIWSGTGNDLDCSPCGIGGKFYAGGEDGTLHTLDAKSGAVL